MSEIQTRAATDEYRSNFDRIFGKKSEEVKTYKLEVTPIDNGYYRWSVTAIGAGAPEVQGSEQSVVDAARAGAEAIQRRMV